jgi:hypothetical protein
MNDLTLLFAGSLENRAAGGHCGVAWVEQQLFLRQPVKIRENIWQFVSFHNVMNRIHG